MCGCVSINVYDAMTGDVISNFKYLINEDNVGDPQTDIPQDERDPSRFPSLKPATSYSPIVRSGEVGPDSLPYAPLPAGKYLISVLAPGYKMGGEWINVTAGEIASLEAFLQPNPLPLSKIRVHVFHDNHPVNGEDDVPLESGLEGFTIIIEDAVGEVTVDYFGNPLGAQYEQNHDGSLVFGEDGNPIPIPSTGGRIITDANGDAVIENLTPGK